MQSVLHYLRELTTGELHYCTRTVTTFETRAVWSGCLAPCSPVLLSHPHTTATFAPRRVVVHREDDPPPAVPRGRGEVQLFKHPNRATCRILCSVGKK
jgi:hypothetical protein